MLSVGIDSVPLAMMSPGTSGAISMSGGICIPGGTTYIQPASTHGDIQRPLYHYKLYKKVLLHLMYYSHQEIPEVVPVVGSP